MGAREALVQALRDLPGGMVRWASDPPDEIPRLASGVPALDSLLSGGWPRGRLCALLPESPGSPGCTSLAVATIAATTRQGLVASWVDGDGSLDPVSLRCSGADLERILWVRGPLSFERSLAAAEAVLLAGGFELVVIRPPPRTRGFGQDSPWLRLSRAAERARTTILAIDPGGAASAHAAIRLDTSGIRIEWDGQAGPGRILLGARIGIRAGGTPVPILLIPPEGTIYPFNSRDFPVESHAVEPAAFGRRQVAAVRGHLSP